MARSLKGSVSVKQVGVDVKEASMMIINNAERFGLAQLHQLRGRVGRGVRKSKCFLVNADREDRGKDSTKRLSLMASEHNGLRLAEADLVTRYAYGSRSCWAQIGHGQS